jgi:hypothetical protein
MMSAIKKFFSKFINKPINDGYGFTNDNNLKVKEIPQELVDGKPVYRNTALYEMNHEAGLFELVGFRRTDKGNSSVTLRCNKTADTFTISKNLFSLLFKKHTRY